MAKGHRILTNRHRFPANRICIWRSAFASWPIVFASKQISLVHPHRVFAQLQDALAACESSSPIAAAMFQIGGGRFYEAVALTAKNAEIFFAISSSHSAICRLFSQRLDDATLFARRVVSGVFSDGRFLSRRRLPCPSLTFA